MRRGILAAAALAFAVLLAAPGQALAARTWVEGGASAYSVAATEGASVRSVKGAPGLALVRSVLWEYRRTTAGFDPFFAERLANGNTLITSRDNVIAEVTRGKSTVWSYTRNGDNTDLEYTYAAKRLANGNTLVTDRAIDRVIEVTPDKRVVWQYGATRNSTAPGNLADPFFAERLPDGTTLIVDNRGGNRVMKVRTSDYDPGKPNWGYTAASVVWQYGQNGVGGTGPDQLASPRFAEALPDGSVLIADSSDQVYKGERVIEVTPDKQIRWQFGVTGVSGTDTTHLFKPSSARRLANGNTLIGEEDGGRVLEISPAGSVVDWYGTGAENGEGSDLGKLRSIQRTEEGSLVSDQQNSRVIEIGYARSGSLTSEALALGLPGVRKTVSSIVLTAETPEGTSAKVEYSLDGGAWKSPKADGTLPAKTTATLVRYRVLLATTSAYTPVLRDIRIGYDVYVPGTTPTGGSTATDSSTSGGTGTGSSSGSSGHSKPRRKVGLGTRIGTTVPTLVPGASTFSTGTPGGLGISGGPMTSTGASVALTAGPQQVEGSVMKQSSARNPTASGPGVSGSDRVSSRNRGVALGVVAVFFLFGAGTGAAPVSGFAGAMARTSFNVFGRS
ncbi:MAG TPA: hypothetical protein VFG89_05930 [Coriobacteriia bacterium]|nr:hypothetical protein [Coriobacteriia bacterium]